MMTLELFRRAKVILVLNFKQVHVHWQNESDIHICLLSV